MINILWLRVVMVSLFQGCFSISEMTCNTYFTGCLINHMFRFHVQICLMLEDIFNNAILIYCLKGRGMDQIGCVEEYYKLMLKPNTDCSPFPPISTAISTFSPEMLTKHRKPQWCLDICTANLLNQETGIFERVFFFVHSKITWYRILHLTVTRKNPLKTFFNGWIRF